MMLKKIRIAVATVLFLLITFYFLDFADILPYHFHALAQIQFVPALLAGSFAVVIILLLATLLLGRVYCSVICPMGIFQDLVSWFSKRFKRKQKYNYSKEKKILRYAILAAVIIAYLLGGTVLLSLLDPYSAFGRMVTNVFRPVYLAGNNLLAAIFNHFDNYALYNVNIWVLSTFSLIIGLITFIGIALLAWRYGRTYCNTICPVGTILGFVSKFSILKIHINDEACTTCGLCEKKCKASCIDSKNRSVDYSRCVDCFNCLDVCKKKAITYQFARKEKKQASPATTDTSKRQFLSALAITAMVIPSKVIAQGLSKIKTNTGYRKKYPLSPPGSVSAEHLLEHCTACHLCVAKCPSNILKPAFNEYGLGGMMQPRMDFIHGFCNFDCTVCSSVCPNGAMHPLTKEGKHALQMGKVVFVKSNCVVFTDETSCGACSEHCPTQAVSMVPYKNSLTIPSINTDICVGCGGCEYICPVRPFRAIYIEGNPVHLQAKHFKEAETKKVNLESFGF
jgi:polyferredoxin